MLAARTREAYRLLHDGCIALSRVEANGIRIDVGRLDETIVRVGRRIEALESRLQGSEEWETWQRRFGRKASLGSRPQLGTVLAELGCSTGIATKTGRMKVSEGALESVDILFVKSFLEVEKLKKLLGTYLKGIRGEVVDGFLRPSFNLHLVRTFRSSCDSPNFQNIPIRDKTIGKLIRSCFVPREGHVLVEADFKALEFKICACHWRDENMIAYASNPEKDIHRDMAMECYCLPLSKVSSEARFYAKNQFVFPTLYGSYHVNTSKNLWNVIGTAHLSVDGVGLYDWLTDRGMSDLSAYEEHVKGAEENFNGMFPEWSVGKEKWIFDYQRRGWFETLTGFVCSGLYKRNELLNYPIQGPAFHCLLWCLIRLVKWLEKNRMRSKIVGQIHDSIVADVHRDELDEFVGMVRRVMGRDIGRAWSWIVVPLGVDIEVGEENWFEKKRIA